MSRRRRPAASGGGSLHWPGDSWLHRVPAGLKLLALFIGAAVVVAVDRASVSAIVAVLAGAAILSAGVPGRELARQARPVVLLLVMLMALQALVGRAGEGALASLRILSVALLALAVTLTTSAPEMVAWLERALTRLRVRPGRVFKIGLVVGLALRSLDHLGVVAGRVLDARRARGLQRSVRAFAVPTVVAAARFAHGVGEALEARGIADPHPRPRDGRAG